MLGCVEFPSAGLVWASSTSVDASIAINNTSKMPVFNFARFTIITYFFMFLDWLAVLNDPFMEQGF